MSETEHTVWKPTSGPPVRTDHGEAYTIRWAHSSTDERILWVDFAVYAVVAVNPSLYEPPDCDKGFV